MADNSQSPSLGHLGRALQACFNTSTWSLALANCPGWSVPPPPAGKKSENSVRGELSGSPGGPVCSDAVSVSQEIQLGGILLLWAPGFPVGWVLPPLSQGPLLTTLPVLSGPPWPYKQVGLDIRVGVAGPSLAGTPVQGSTVCGILGSPFR